MLDFIVELFLNTLMRPNVVAATRLAFLVLLVYLAICKIRALSKAALWKLVKVILIVLFLPFVILWKVTTAGSDCSCCCDEDD
jgi:beta-lactamase regulating signal transducer with metallopeptidase domain